MNRETISWWQKDHSLPHYPPLRENREADVCIIGAGIAGLTAAYLLSKAKKTVVLIDDGPIAGGQTIRTTGHLTSLLDERFYKLAKTFDEKTVKLAVESHEQAIDFIEKLVKSQKIECNFERVNAYLFADVDQSSDFLEKELKACHLAGLTEAKLVDKLPLESFNIGPALCVPQQAQISPLPYLKKLCELILTHKGEIFTSTHVDEVEEKNGSFHLKTSESLTIKAKHVVYASNALTGKFMSHKQAQYRTYVIGAKISLGSVNHALYYDNLDPYHYVRVVKHTDHSDLLIVGGEDHRTAENDSPNDQYVELERWARDRFPMMHQVTHQWSGQVVEPVDNLAFIGRAKKDLENYFISGHSGNGLTYGTLGAMLIHDLILGIANPWEKIYDPNRSLFKNTTEMLKENLNSISQYRDWITPGDGSTVKKLKKNCGAVIRNGLKKTACYKDEDGKVHQMSAKCPHMGALVRWNDSEHCWECPAHGSRFSAEGKCLLGPANCDMTPK